MSGPIDVIAVMNDAALSQAISGDRADMREARDAVADLIEAGSDFVADDSLDAQRRFKAALARATGEQA